jgi:8-oxo-dGTP diphosphatase
MIRYVAGFCYTEDRQRVLLVRKKKPTWQANKLNGVGGRVEDDESFEAAMAREFSEEVGVACVPWERTVTITLSERPVQIACFRAFSDIVRSHPQKNDIGELLGLHNVDGLRFDNLANNVAWLIPLHLDDVAFPMNVMDIGRDEDRDAANAIMEGGINDHPVACQ